MDLKEVCINTRNLIDSAQDNYFWRAVVNAAFPYAFEALKIIININTGMEKICFNSHAIHRVKMRETIVL